jgi:NAD-dependent dihydropyrimidine dehydrogenase PreA subunit
MGKTSISRTKDELEYINRVNKMPNNVIMAHEDSAQEGFEYIESDEFMQQYSAHGSLMKDMLLSPGLRKIPTNLKIFVKYLRPMARGRNECFTDLNEYLNEIESTSKPSQDRSPLVASYPNQKLWEELTMYAWDRWKVIFGFTELPSQLIFKGKAVLFKYSLICIQEMDKEKIDRAPGLAAGEEAFRVYDTLGRAANDIARWLRHNHGIRCQSNHPIGGLVNFPPLAAKAGLGWQGRDGLLITPQYGQRQRIAAIFLEDKIFEFTDNNNHVWIEEYCPTCRKCQEACPTNAIYSEKRIGIRNVEGIGQTRTCIDLAKCYPQFTKTLGCSICVKVCPFSQGGKSYYAIKQALNKM